MSSFDFCCRLLTVSLRKISMRAGMLPMLSSVLGALGSWLKHAAHWRHGVSNRRGKQWESHPPLTAATGFVFGNLLPVAGTRVNKANFRVTHGLCSWWSCCYFSGKSVTVKRILDWNCGIPPLLVTYFHGDPSHCAKLTLPISATTVLSHLQVASTDCSIK